MADFETIDIRLDTANAAIPPVRLHAGDINGRTLVVHPTDNGRKFADGEVTARLTWNPDRSDPVSAGGSMAFSSTSADGLIDTFNLPVPRDLLAHAGAEPVLGIELTRTASGNVICSRNIPVIVEPAVLNADAPAIADPLLELHNAAATAKQAAADAKTAVDTANQVIDGASIDAGTTSTLLPSQEARSALKGTGLKRTLDLGIPRGRGIAGVTATGLEAGAEPTASATLNDDGDYNLALGIPAGAKGDTGPAGGFPRVATVDVESNGTVNVSDLHPSDNVKAGESVLDADGDTYTITSVADGVAHVGPALTNLKGPAGDAGAIASATTAGVVKVGSGLDIAADGTLSAQAYTLPKASAYTLGGIRLGNTLTANADGIANVDTQALPTASATTAGVVKVGKTMTIANDGTLDASGGAAGAKYPGVLWFNDLTSTPDPHYSTFSLPCTVYHPKENPANIVFVVDSFGSDLPYAAYGGEAPVTGVMTATLETIWSPIFGGTGYLDVADVDASTVSAAADMPFVYESKGTLRLGVVQFAAFGQKSVTSDAVFPKVTFTFPDTIEGVDPPKNKKTFALPSVGFKWILKPAPAADAPAAAAAVKAPAAGSAKKWTLSFAGQPAADAGGKAVA